MLGTEPMASSACDPATTRPSSQRTTHRRRRCGRSRRPAPPSAATRPAAGSPPPAPPPPRGPCSAAPAGGSRAATPSSRAWRTCARTRRRSRRSRSRRGARAASAAGSTAAVVRMRSPSGVHQSGMRGPGAGGDEHGVGDELLRRRSTSPPRPGAGRRGGPCPGACAPAGSASSCSIDVFSLRDDALDPLLQRAQVDLGLDPVEAHALDAPGEAHGPAGRDHRLRRDAVPQVSGAADDVALDHRDVGAEAGRPRGCGVAGRAASDDDEAEWHATRLVAVSQRVGQCLAASARSVTMFGQ